MSELFDNDTIEDILKIIIGNLNLRINSYQTKQGMENIQQRALISQDDIIDSLREQRFAKSSLPWTY